MNCSLQSDGNWPRTDPAPAAGRKASGPSLPNLGISIPQRRRSESDGPCGTFALRLKLLINHGRRGARCGWQNFTGPSWASSSGYPGNRETIICRFTFARHAGKISSWGRAFEERAVWVPALGQTCAWPRARRAAASVRPSNSTWAAPRFDRLSWRPEAGCAYLSGASSLLAGPFRGSVSAPDGVPMGRSTGSTCQGLFRWPETGGFNVLGLVKDRRAADCGFQAIVEPCD